jgi:hypothetical protein
MKSQIEHINIHSFHLISEMFTIYLPFYIARRLALNLCNYQRGGKGKGKGREGEGKEKRREWEWEGKVRIGLSWVKRRDLGWVKGGDKGWVKGVKQGKS